MHRSHCDEFSNEEGKRKEHEVRREPTLLMHPISLLSWKRQTGKTPLRLLLEVTEPFLRVAEEQERQEPDSEGAGGEEGESAENS